MIRDLLLAGSGSSISLVGSATKQNSTSATTIVIDKPTGTFQNNVMFAVISSDSGTFSSWSSSGWTVAESQTSAPSLVVLYKTAGASEPSTYTFTSSNSVVHSGCILSFTNGTYGGIGAMSNTSTANSVTISANNSTLLGAYATPSASATFSAPSGMASLLSDSDATGPSYNIFIAQFQASGATGTKASTLTGGTGAGSVLWYLTP